MRVIHRKRSISWPLWLTIAVSGYGTAIQSQSVPPGRQASPGVIHEKSRDMDLIHRMFAATEKIRRTVKKTSQGVEATTESRDPKVATMIQKHAHAMQARLQKHQPIRAWDPLFAVLFDHADKIKLRITNTRHGVKITETSADPDTVRIIHAHADAVSGFVHEGMAGMAKRHEAPAMDRLANKKQTAFLGKGDGAATCPVTGEPVDRSIKAEIAGRTVYFCCASCVAIVKKSPQQYLPGRQANRPPR